MAKVYLDGLLIASSAAERAIVELYLEEHIKLTLQEAGCLKFEVSVDEKNPNKFHVSEIFESESAFEAHQIRAKASEWGQHSIKLERRFRKQIG